MTNVDEETELRKLRNRMVSQFERSQAERGVTLKDLEAAVKEFDAVEEQARKTLRRGQAVLELKQ